MSIKQQTIENISKVLKEEIDAINKSFDKITVTVESTAIRYLKQLYKNQSMDTSLTINSSTVHDLLLYFFLQCKQRKITKTTIVPWDILEAINSLSTGVIIYKGRRLETVFSPKQKIKHHITTNDNELTIKAVLYNKSEDLSVSKNYSVSLDYLLGMLTYIDLVKDKDIHIYFDEIEITNNKHYLARYKNNNDFDTDFNNFVYRISNKEETIFWTFRSLDFVAGIKQMADNLFTNNRKDHHKKLFVTINNNIVVDSINKRLIVE